MSTAYDKMTRAERRVAIAKDVIKHIKAQQLKVKTSYGYVKHPQGMAALEHIAKSAYNDKDLANKLKQECGVCARGAMMLCKVAKFNNYNFDIQNYGYLGGWDTFEALRDAFSMDQLDAIERAFEGTDLESVFVHIQDPSDRLLAIMQNIVDHNGTFKPQVAYEVIG